MRIAVPQYTFSKDHKRMLRRALDEIASAGAQDADLVCFPPWFVALNPVAETERAFALGRKVAAHRAQFSHADALDKGRDMSEDKPYG